MTVATISLFSWESHSNLLATEGPKHQWFLRKPLQLSTQPSCATVSLLPGNRAFSHLQWMQQDKTLFHWIIMVIKCHSILRSILDFKWKKKRNQIHVSYQAGISNTANKALVVVNSICRSPFHLLVCLPVSCVIVVLLSVTFSVLPNQTAFVHVNKHIYPHVKDCIKPPKCKINQMN